MSFLRIGSALQAVGALAGFALVPGIAQAVPRVCGDQAALGNFPADPSTCPQMLDDGVPPDEKANDGIYTLGVQLKPTAYLNYKILASGVYAPAGTEISAAAGCGLGDGGANPDGNIVVPNPDTTSQSVFYYDSRNLTDPSYAPVNNNHSGGDNIMTSAPKGSGTRWVVVGDFQALAFNAVQGVVELTENPPGVLTGSVVTTAALPTGWQWKVLEDIGTYTGARKFGTSGTADDGSGHDGWSYTPCDSHNVHVQAVPAGTTVQFVFYAHYGRLQTVLPGGVLDMGAGADMRAGNPPAADLLVPAGADLLLINGDGGGDGSLTGNLPGVHCNCQLGQGRDPSAGTGVALGVVALALGLFRRRLRQPGSAGAMGGR